MKKRVLIALAAVAGLMLPVELLAEQPDSITVTAKSQYGRHGYYVATARDGVRIAHVSYADLNVANTVGRDRMHARLRRAATAVCDQPTGGNLGVRMAVRGCTAEALRDGVAQLNRAQSMVAQSGE